jgi:hypothetical protein
MPHLGNFWNRRTIVRHISLAFILHWINNLRRSPQRQTMSLGHSATGKHYSYEKGKVIFKIFSLERGVRYCTSQGKENFASTKHIMSKVVYHIYFSIKCNPLSPSFYPTWRHYSDLHFPVYSKNGHWTVCYLQKQQFSQCHRTYKHVLEHPARWNSWQIYRSVHSSPPDDSTTAIIVAEPYEVLLYFHRAKNFRNEHNVARPSFCFGHLK